MRRWPLARNTGAVNSRRSTIEYGLATLVGSPFYFHEVTPINQAHLEGSDRGEPDVISL
ncbi:hypothetical protein [Sulfodiicoccus acidiphilus]|uniref:hypothetical protein n=1 Tax=Sulfodiicoccus acidiphilus TaxID=1670455 RepID=UPI0016634B3F|nr:hypothetical protein [Sulfodiicoccus acidiphilus]